MFLSEKESYRVVGFCAGIQVFREQVAYGDLKRFMDETKEKLKARELSIKFGSGQSQIASEICVDVFDDGSYRHDLSKAFKV